MRYFTKFKSCIFVLRAHVEATILHPNTKVLDFGGAFRVFRGKKQPFFTIAPFPRPFGLERVTFVVELFEVLCYNIFERREMQ